MFSKLSEPLETAEGSLLHEETNLAELGVMGRSLLNLSSVSSLDPLLQQEE